MTLTGKQKRVLRGMGQTLEPMLHIGKDGVSEEAVHATEELLRRRELIKVRVLNNAPAERDELAAQLAVAVRGDIAGGVGKTFLLYRPNPDLRERIILPRATGDTPTP